MPDALKSDFSILELKKQHAQAEVDMFSKVIAHTAGIQYSDDGLLAIFASVVSHLNDFRNVHFLWHCWDIWITSTC